MRAAIANGRLRGLPLIPCAIFRSLEFPPIPASLVPVSTIAEIESAIARLPQSEVARLAVWLDEFRHHSPAPDQVAALGSPSVPATAAAVPAVAKLAPIQSLPILIPAATVAAFTGSPLAAAYAYLQKQPAYASGALVNS